jgi:hypothetical protein
MATALDEILKQFESVAGQQAAAIAGVSYALADVVAQIAGQQNTAVKASATAAPKSTAQADSGGGSAVSDAVSWVGGKFALFPLIGGLISLFSGGAPEAPPPLIKYALPPSNNFQTAETASGVSWSDTDQNGAPRAFGNTAMGAAGPGPGAGGAQAAQITVNVQAMDARSFLDRSQDIALAVRDAMLNLNSINDVVNDL